jgi:hypothetical protein
MQELRSNTVLGMYPTRACVEIAVEAFRDAGFKNAEISIVLPEKMTYHDFSAGKAISAAETLPCDVDMSAVAGPNAWAPEGRFLATGLVAQRLGDPTQGGPSELAAALIHMGIPEYETEDYADKVLKGKALLSIHCDSPERALAARRLHGDIGGMDVFVARSAERTLGNNRWMACSAGK